MKGAIKAAAVVTGLAAWGLVSAARNFLTPRRQPARAGFFGVSTRKWLFMAAAIFTVLAVAGLLTVVSGIVPIKASSGHWAITKWFLNFSMERSVKTHAIGIEAPPLDDPRLVLVGAGHYEIGCRPCHGSPELPHPRVAQAMTPQPPYLPDVLGLWQPNDLFYITKHGVKFTGMPAWPSQQRDDEVWAMVAFLRRLSHLGPQEYRRLVSAEPQVCARCHGGDGLGRGAFPKLAGQKEAYLQAALRAYARGERHSGIMQTVAAGLDEARIPELASYYSRLVAPARAGSSSPGPGIAESGVPAQSVPACAQCHGPGGGPRNPHYPVLAGQYAHYLIQQLELFKNGQRGGSPYAHLMREVAPRLTSEQIREVAQYYASLPLETQ